MTALTDWLASVATSRVVLLHLEPSEALLGWVSAGSGAYSISWSPYTHQQTTPPVLGVYREFLSARENGVDLTARASLAAVQANPGSYFYDEPNTTLYLQTTFTVNPDTLSLVEAVFRVRVSSEPVNFAGTPPYDPQIDGSQLPTLELARATPLVGITSLTAGSIALVNANGFWDAPSIAWNWTNRTVTVLVGGGAMTMADFETVATLQIARPPAASSDLCLFQVRARTNALTRTFPLNSYRDLYGPVPTSSPLFGQYMPLWYGRVYDAPLAPLDSLGITGSGGRTRCNAIDGLAIGSGATGIAVSAVRAYPKVGGAGVTVTDFIVHSNYEIDVDAAYPSSTYDLRADMSLVNVITGAARFVTYGQIVPKLLQWCGVPTAQVNTAAFTALDTVIPQAVGIYIPAGAISDPSVLVTGADLIDLLGRSVLTSLLVGLDGLWTARVFDPSFDFFNLTVLDETTIFSFAVGGSVGEPQISAARITYRPYIGSGTVSDTTRSSTKAAALLGGANTLPVETALVDLADAQVLGDRLVQIGQTPALELHVLLPPDALNALPGDKFRLMRTRGPGASGAFDQVVELTSARKQFADMTVDAVLGNQQGLGESVKRIAPDGTPVYGSATADQQRAYAFDGVIVNHQPQAVLW